MKKTILLLTALILICLLAASCGGEKKPDDTGASSDTASESVQTGGTSTDPAVTFRVAVESGEGYTVGNGGIAEVAYGASAVFDIEIAEGYEFVSVSSGAFEDGKLTVPSVTRPLTVSFTVRKLPEPKESYTVSAGNAEFGAITGAGVYEDGTEVTLKWESDGLHTVSAWIGADGEELARGTEEFTFEVKADVTVSVKCAQRVLVYHANGGKNVAEDGGDVVCRDFDHEVYIYANTMGEELFSTFTRDGYFPIEYNTAPDGSGTAVGIGSRAFLDERHLDLYVIWAKESPASDFECASDGGSGVIVTKYKGGDETVVIPCEIDGRPVTAVGSYAFSGCNMKTLVVTKNVTSVANNAIDKCKQLTTLYLCENASGIFDSAISGYSNLTDLRMIATLPPCFSNNYLSPFVQKLEHVVAARGSKKMIFVGSSSMDYGFDGAYYDSVFGGEYTIINCGLNAQVPGQFVIDVIEEYLEPGDVVIMSCEAGAYTSGYILEWTWCAIESCYDVFRNVDMTDYGNTFNAFNSFMNGSRFGKLGAIAGGKQKTYADFNKSYNNKYAELTVERKYDSTRTYNKDIYFLPNRFGGDRISAFNDLNEKLVDRGAKLYFTFFPVFEGAVATDQAGREGYAAYLRKGLDFPVISTVDDYMFTAENIYDSAVHCTNAGALLRSRRLAADILAQFEKEAKAE